jgi:hypothetical protein
VNSGPACQLITRKKSGLLVFDQDIRFFLQVEKIFWQRHILVPLLDGNFACPSEVCGLDKNTLEVRRSLWRNLFMKPIVAG